MSSDLSSINTLDERKASIFITEMVFPGKEGSKSQMVLYLKDIMKGNQEEMQQTEVKP